MDQIFATFLVALISNRLARGAVFIIITLAALPNVTSRGQVFANQPNPDMVIAAAGTDAAKAAPKKEVGDEDDDDDDDDDQFKQPVRAGDLIGRDVIAPVESQDLLGHVVKIVQRDDDYTIVMTYGGQFGIGGHPVCVAADAFALTGITLQAKEISTEDLNKLPVCDGSGNTPVDPNVRFQMKLAKPAH